MNTEDKVAALKSSGFPVRYANRADAEPLGYLDALDVSGYAGEDYEPYVSLESVAAGEDRADQTSTVHRSNYRVLKAEDESRVGNGENPYFTDLSYSNVTVLGAFVDDLDDDMIDTLCGLASGYPILNESDLSELESEEVTSSWGQYLDSDLFREIGKLEMVGDESEETRAALLTSAQVEFWQSMNETERAEVFWEILQSRDYYPEHNGLDVLWDYDELTAWISEWLRERA